MDESNSTIIRSDIVQCIQVDDKGADCYNENEYQNLTADVCRLDIELIADTSSQALSKIAPTKNGRDMPALIEKRASILVNESIELLCNATCHGSQSDENTYEWFIKKSTRIDGHTYRTEEISLNCTNSTYAIENATPDFTGVYVCVATDEVGNHQKASIHVDVVCKSENIHFHWDFFENSIYFISFKIRISKFATNPEIIGSI